MEYQMRGNCKNRNGFSLAEAMIAVVILGMATTAVIVPFSTGAAVQAEGRHRTLAVKLAGDLMEEIVDTPFAQIVSTYNGYAEAQGQVRNTADVVFTDSNYAMFSRNASCANVYVPQESGVVASQFIRATVRVYYGGQEIVSVSRLVSE